MTGLLEMWGQMRVAERLWQMSLLAGMLIGFVLILRLLLRRCSKGYSYGLWLLVLLRLLCPIFIESDYSMQPLFLSGEAADIQGNSQLQPPAAQASSGTVGSHGEGQAVGQGEDSVPGQMGMKEGEWNPSGDFAAFPSGDGGKGQSAFFRENAPESLSSPGKAQRWYDGRNAAADAGLWRRCLPLLRRIYMLGAGALMLYFAALYIGWRRRLADAVHMRDNIWCSERVASPFVLGVLRPRIYLPYRLTEAEERHILLHEQSHIRHRDPLLRLLGTLALCLHWWNPLVWLGIHLFYQDMEMFCDETAMARAELPDRQAYSATLLQFAIRQSSPAVLAFGETHTERRIRNILERKRRGRGITLLVALAAAAGGCIFLTVPQGAEAGMLEKAPVSNGSGQQTGSAAQGRLERLQDFVLSQGQAETSAGETVTLRLVLTEGAYIAYQTAEGELAEQYEGSYELQALDDQDQLLDSARLSNGQGSDVMSFACRDFPWHFEDYNLDGQQDFFLGTKTPDGRSYYYLFTITAEGGLAYLFDGAMWGDYFPMEAEDITDAHLESGGERDFREMLFYQADEEYSSHDFYSWSPYLGEYRKRVEFTGVYPEGWNQDAADYLEGEWRVSGIEIWDQEQSRPDNRIGEILSYEDGVFRQLDAAGNVVYESEITGCSSLVQSPEEFWDTFNIAAWLTEEAENARRILINLGEECRMGNVVYVLGDNSMLVYDPAGTGAFWTATRVELQGEAAEAQQYLQGAWEVTGIAGRPYDALEPEEAEALLGTRLTYDWQHTAHEYTIERPRDDSAYSMPIQGFGQFVDSSSDLSREAGLPEEELVGIHVRLGEGEFFGADMYRIDEDTVWIYYEGTFFEAKRVL